MGRSTLSEMAVLRWLRNLLNSRSLDADINDEVCFHLKMRADSHMRAGMSEEDAMAFADKQFGEIETIKRAMRRARMHPTYALSAGLTAVVVVFVALWFYDSSLSSELPSLPPGMRFVGGPPPAP
jgi:hypothetical protein